MKTVSMPSQTTTHAQVISIRSLRRVTCNRPNVQTTCCSQCLVWWRKFWIGTAYGHRRLWMIILTICRAQKLTTSSTKKMSRRMPLLIKYRVSTNRIYRQVPFSLLSYLFSRLCSNYERNWVSIAFIFSRWASTLQVTVNLTTIRNAPSGGNNKESGRRNQPPEEVLQPWKIMMARMPT